ncbi:MAG: hypothetical protein PHY51_04625, partial [Candidatus Gracilibacteria bacterium]|nr:hypothetical protein [Candidatus Gracilibacteria bacterium]
MGNFEKYLGSLSDHELEKYFNITPREKLLALSGIALNWIGDFVSNPNIRFKEIEVDIRDILFTGTKPEINEILINQAEKKPENLKILLNDNPEIKEKLEKWASFGNEPVLFRKDGQKYKVVDGIHRLVGAVIQGKEKILGYIPINFEEHLPYCESHVIYDLIRGFQRNAKNEQGKIELYHALKLLIKS